MEDFKLKTRRCISFEDEDDLDLDLKLTPISKKFESRGDEITRKNEVGCTNYEREGVDTSEKTNQCDREGRKAFGESRSSLIVSSFINNEITPKRTETNGEKHHIMKVEALLAKSEDFLSDGSTMYKLPIVSGRHTDIKYVSPQTLKGLMEGKYDDVIENYAIVDCRYPYEYEGGHIMRLAGHNFVLGGAILVDLTTRGFNPRSQDVYAEDIGRVSPIMTLYEGAENLYTQDMITERLLSNVNSTKKTVVIFHCEFSSERGPKLLRHLRNTDRKLNAENYPNLYYPEIYLLQGGYKEFYHQQKALCDPQNYTTMVNKDFTKELRYFRSKSKSWHAGNRRKSLRY